MSEYRFDRLINTQDFEIRIDTASCYGYFEHERFGDNCGGGLWFERIEGGILALIDYDGVFSLPKEVKRALVSCDFVVSEEF